MYPLNDAPFVHRIVCLICVIYQVTVSVIDYQSYATIIETSLVRENLTVLPKVTVCSRYGNWERDPRLPAGSAKWYIYNSVRKSEMVHHCWLALPGGSRSNCTEQGSEIGFGTYYHKCFEINSKLYVYDHQFRTEMFTAALNRNSTYWGEMMIVSIYDDKPTIFEGELSVALSFYAYLRKIVFTFDTHYYHSLPYPYDSQCVDYRSAYEGRSKRDMIDNCTISAYLKNNEWPADQLVFEDSPTIGANGQEALPIEYQQIIRDHCNDRFLRPDCSRKLYIIQTKSERRQEPLALSELSTNQAEFSIVQPNMPSLVVYLKPRVEFSIFLSNIGGIIGLWLGLCFEDLCNRVMNIYWSIKVARKIVPLRRVRMFRRRWSGAQRTRMISTALCSIGFGYHCWTIFDLYFTSPFVTESQIVSVNHIMVPQVSVCADYDHRRPLDTGPKKFQYLEIKGNESTKFYFQPSDGLVRGNRVRKCFTFMSNRSQLYPQSFSEIININWVSIWVSLNRRTLENLSYFIHDSSSFPDMIESDAAKWFKVSYRSRYFIREYSFVYQNLSSSMLEHHAFSTCTNYGTLGFESRHDAIAKCVLARYLGQEQQLPPSVYVDLASEAAQYFSFGSNSLLERALVTGCVRLFPKPDCYKETYKLDTLFTKTWRYEDYFVLKLTGPVNTEIRNVQKVRFTVVELLCYIGGLMGCWLGLSMMSIGEPLIDLVRRSALKRQRAKKSKPVRKVNRRRKARHVQIPKIVYRSPLQNCRLQAALLRK